MTAFERLLSALETAGQRTTGSGRQRMAQCPAHDDGHASLSVTQGNDRVLVKCQAGCDTDEVLASLDLTRADLFDTSRQNSNGAGRRIVATYDYTDEAGELLYQSVRYEPKGFQQRRPDGRGDWIYKLGDTRRVLYRLPRVLVAAKAGQTIYVVEGEKDVHSIENIGAVATCNSGGAGNGKWKPHYSEALTGASVVIVTDRDEPGRAHARGILASLRKSGITARILEPTTGKDVTDHLNAGLGLADLAPVVTEGDTDTGSRRIVLTKASSIKPRPVFWLWKQRLALGTLGLLAGREGLGKSTLGYWIAARLTRGDLYGHFYGKPRTVLVCATEDSWEHTIVPRLMAAGADLDLVERVEVLNAIDIHVGLSLPRDMTAVEQAAKETNAALLILDPLMSRLDDDLDTHRDGQVRRALEPLVEMADRMSMAILGLIHHNKSGSTDPLQLVMASRAFTAVARSVHTVMPDPDDDTNTRRLFGTPKNNLGRIDLPTFSFTISGFAIDTDEGTAWTGKLEWGDERTDSIGDVMRRAGADDTEGRGALSEATDWLDDYLASKGGQVPSADAKRHGKAAGHSVRSLVRARERLNLVITRTGFPQLTYWEFAPVEPVAPTSPHVGATVPRGEISAVTTTTSRRDSTVAPAEPVAPADRDVRDVPGATDGWEQTTLGQRNHGATP